MTRERRVVIGIGNTLRRDDGVGPAVVAALEVAAPSDTRLLFSDGEPLALLEAWRDAELAIVVDAVRPTAAMPGAIHRIVLAAGQFTVLDRRMPGSHDFALTDTVRLAAVLDRCPGRLIGYAVEVAEAEFGPGLSPEVARAVPEVCRRIVAELDATIRSGAPS
jgi:hydrogenase maturation protease